MKKKNIALVLLSSTCLATGVAFSSWLIEANNKVDLYKVEDVPVAYIIGHEDVKYTTIEKALEVANSGDIVCLIPPTLDNYHDTNNTIIPDKVTYEINRNCEIKAGVTLIIPTDKTTLNTVSNSSTLQTYITSMEQDDGSKGTLNATISDYNNDTINKYLRVTVKINNGITLINNGNLIISGYLSSGTGQSGRMSHTGYSYSEIELGNNASIVQNNSAAKTYCYGFIKEKTLNNDSSININNGELYIPFCIKDYNGFNASWAMTYSGGAIDQGCSPFNIFEFINIHSSLNIKYSASVYGKVNLYVDYNGAIKVNKHFYETISFVGNSSSFFIQQTDSNYSYLSYKYNKTTTSASINFYGGMTLNNLNLSFSESGLKVNLSTNKAFFPVSYMFQITLNKANGQVNNAIYNFTNQKIKLLTGSSLTINNGVTVNASSLIVYTAFFDSGLNVNKKRAGVEAYPNKSGAILKIENGGLINATSVAGNVYSDSSNNIVCSGSTSITSKEPWGYGSSGASALSILGGTPAWKFDDYLEIREILSVAPLINLTKFKLYCGLNIFSTLTSYLPSYKVFIDNDTTNPIIISNYQKVVFLDTISSYKLDFISNIYQAYNRNNASYSYYKKNSTITYSEAKSSITALSSNISISDNNNGVNEFNTQQVIVECITPLVNNKVPLYAPDTGATLGSSITLKANVIDINKCYDKTITWSSSDSTKVKITVDATTNNLTVTGKEVGNVRITATSDGEDGDIDLTVLPSQVIESISSIYISNNMNGKTSADTPSGSDSEQYHYQSGNNTTIKFTLHINPTTASYKSIKRELKNISGSLPNRQSMVDASGNDITTQILENSMDCYVKIKSGSGASPDYVKLQCDVEDLNGNKLSTTFYIEHKADISIPPCLTPDALITMSDLTYKKAIDLRSGDIVKCFNHETGEIIDAPIIINADIEQEIPTYRNVLYLTFENNKVVGVIGEHGFFDTHTNKYEYIRINNYKEFINHYFIEIKDNKINRVKLIKGEVKKELTRICSPVSYRHFDIISEDMLSITGAIPGLFNIFEYDPITLKFDESKKEEDIKKYGLLAYKDYSYLIDELIYNGLPCDYISVSEGKGMIKMEFFIELIKRYVITKVDEDKIKDFFKNN